MVKSILHEFVEIMDPFSFEVILLKIGYHF